MLGDTAMGLVDAKLVGALGAEALGGVGMGVVLMYLGNSFALGAMRGVKIATSHAVGEGRPEDARRYLAAGATVAFFVGLLVLVAARDASALLRAFGTAEPLVVPARDFLAAVTLGSPAVAVEAALVQQRQALGDTRTPMWVGLGSNALNALLGYGLVGGHLGLPALGAAGAGLATALAHGAGCATLGALALRAPRGSGVSALPFRRAVREVLALGLPTGAQWTLESLSFSTFALVLGTLGTREVAANHLALNVLRVSFLPGVAVSEATSVLVGQALGARRLDEARRALGAGLALAVSFMLACGLVFATAGEAIARAFTDDPVLARATARLLLVAALFQLLDAVQIVLRGALRGAKVVLGVAIVGVAASWTFVPTSAWLLGKRAGLGAVGGWLGFVGETVVVSAVLGWLWRHGSWRRAYAARPVPAPSA